MDDADAATPLLSNATRWASDKHNYTSVETTGSNPSPEFHIPSWVRVRKDQNGRPMPQSIAHRGYKAKHPENTMGAFKGAVDVKAHALETDIHLSKDGVVVLSHDGDLKRCFGEKAKIIDCDWEYLSQVRTLKEPHEPMPRLKDLLEYIAQPDLQYLWVMLDIKLDNDADTVMRLIKATVDSVPPGARPWSDRLVLGIWAAKFLPLCSQYLPGFPVSHICFSTCYARKFLLAPGVSFNILQKVLLGPIGTRFIRDVKAQNRPIFAWTVNEVNMMKWCVQRELDGVITDDPKTFNDVCDSWTGNEPVARATVFQWLYTFWLYMIIGIFSRPFFRRYPETVEQVIGTKQHRAQATLKLGA